MTKRLILAVLLLLPGLASAQSANDIMLVIDNSGSMRQNDPGYLAKAAVNTFVDKLGGDTRLGVIIFDQRVNYSVPLNELNDTARQAVANSLNGINYRGQLTDSPSAVEKAIYELKTNGRASANRSIVFMTDGIVDTGNKDIDVDKTRWLRDELSAQAAAEGIKIYAVAFTDNADFFLIQSLAQKTGGEYFRAPRAADLGGVFDNVNRSLNAVVAPRPAPAPAPRDVPAPVNPPAPVVAEEETSDATDLGLTDEERRLFEEAGIDPAELEAVEPGQAIIVPPPAPAADNGAVDALELTDEERKLFEEAGLDPDALSAATPGQVIVVPPPAQSGPNGLLMLVLGVASVGILLVGIGLFMRARRGNAASEEQAPVSVAPDVPPSAYILDIDNVTGERMHALGQKPMMVGRVAGNDAEHLDYVVINRPTVGRRHAVLKYKDFSFWVIDQGSVNGTFLNGSRVVGERQMKHGDVIKFHKYEFKFEVPEWADGADEQFAGAAATVVADADATIAAAAPVLAAGGAAGAAVAAAAARSAPVEDDMFGGLSDEDELDVTAQDDGLDPVLPLPEPTQQLKPGSIPAYEPDETGEQQILNLSDTADDVAFQADASAFFGETDPMMADDGGIVLPDDDSIFAAMNDTSSPGTIFTSTEIGPTEVQAQTTMINPATELKATEIPDDSEFADFDMLADSAPAATVGTDTLINDDALDGGPPTREFAVTDEFDKTSAGDISAVDLDVSMSEYMDEPTQVDGKTEGPGRFPDDPDDWDDELGDASGMFDLPDDDKKS
ncbi:MAG: VWA domain-containing protein [Gammaproteobacteria bacterium]|nr:VWA domain-containing protein [Gammaproteobacteria bacterium]